MPNCTHPNIAITKPFDECEDDELNPYICVECGYRSNLRIRRRSKAPKGKYTNKPAARYQVYANDPCRAVWREVYSEPHRVKGKYAPNYDPQVPETR